MKNEKKPKPEQKPEPSKMSLSGKYNPAAWRSNEPLYSSRIRWS
jgi:hypothetical protein